MSLNPDEYANVCEFCGAQPGQPCVLVRRKGYDTVVRKRPHMKRSLGSTVPTQTEHWRNDLINLAEQFDEYEQQCAGLIAEFGWMVQGVFSAQDDPEPGPSFYYTVGLTLLGHPEFITFSLPPDVAKTVLNFLGSRVKAGSMFLAGPIDGVLRAHSSYLLPVTDTRQHLNLANRFFPEVQALQFIWPDKEGRFPWEEGYDIDPKAQPLLGKAPKKRRPPSHRAL